MTDLEFLTAIKSYMEEMEECVDGEWGASRTADKLIRSGQMPQLYSEVVRRIDLQHPQVKETTAMDEHYEWELEDEHYEWELEDASGEWAAGGSANELEAVQNEGLRYFAAYLKDGPHKLIIRKHQVHTIMEMTNATSEGD